MDRPYLSPVEIKSTTDSIELPSTEDLEQWRTMPLERARIAGFTLLSSHLGRIAGRLVDWRRTRKSRPPRDVRNEAAERVAMPPEEYYRRKTGELIKRTKKFHDASNEPLPLGLTGTLVGEGRRPGGEVEIEAPGSWAVPASREQAEALGLDHTKSEGSVRIGAYAVLDRSCYIHGQIGDLPMTWDIRRGNERVVTGLALIDMSKARDLEQLTERVVDTVELTPEFLRVRKHEEAAAEVFRGIDSGLRLIKAETHGHRKY